MKICTDCNKSQDEKNFNFRDKKLGVLQNRCKPCHSLYRKSHYDLNRSHYIEISKKWYAENSGRVGKTRLKAKYGISPVEHEELATKQKNRCAICDEKTKLCVDHCHKTDKVRGLLCRACNLALGHIKDNEQIATNLLTYIRTRV